MTPEFERSIHFIAGGVEIELADSAQIKSLTSDAELSGKEFAQKKWLALYFGVDNTFVFDNETAEIKSSFEVPITQAKVIGGNRNTVKRIKRRLASIGA